MKAMVAAAAVLGVLFFGLVLPRESLGYLGAYEIPTKEWAFEGVPVVEISGLSYDAAEDRYYAISDDRGDTGTPGRLFTLRVDAGPRGISGVDVLSMTPLDSDGATPGAQPYPAKGIDAEEVVLCPDGTLVVSSERDLENRPWIRRFAGDGSLLAEIALPVKVLPATGRGVRRNLAFEAMTLSPDGRTLYVMNEQALEQDGPISTVEAGTAVRLFVIDLSPGSPRVVGEHVYVTEPIFAAPKGESPYADNGVPAVLWAKPFLPEWDLLVVERAFVSGVGNEIAVFGIRLAGADDVSSLEAIPSPFRGRALEKRLLFRLSAVPERSSAPLRPDNLEAITVGPRLPNGHPTLLLASDNNASADQRNLFVLLEVLR